MQLLNKLMPQLNLLADEELLDRIEECREQLDIAEQDESFIRQHGVALSLIRTDSQYLTKRSRKL